MTHVHLLIGWFVSRIKQKLLNRFPRNLDGGWVSAQNRPHYFWFGPGLRDRIFYFPFFNTVRSGAHSLYVRVAGINVMWILDLVIWIYGGFKFWVTQSHWVCYGIRLDWIKGSVRKNFSRKHSKNNKSTKCEEVMVLSWWGRFIALQRYLHKLAC